MTSLLGSRLAYKGDFVVTVGSLWGHFGVTLGALAAYGGAFGGHFEVLLG